METQLPQEGSTAAPRFGPCLLWPYGLIVLDGDSATPSKGALQPPALVYCGQTGVWIKVSLDTEVGLGLGHIVLDDRHPAPPK